MNKKMAIFDDFRTDKKYDVSMLSEIGKRESQQDAAYVAANDDMVLAILCDGMGGKNAGALASKTAVEAFLDFFSVYSRSDQEFNCSWTKTSVEQIDDIIYNLRDKEGNRIDCGCTLVAVMICKNQLHWISVGDSRLYIIRGNEIVQVNTDHNYVYELDRKLRNHEIDMKTYNANLYKKDALISFIGMGGLTMMDISNEPFNLLKDDVVLLCTDGLYRAVNQDEICKIVETSCDMEKACIRLSYEIQCKAIKDQDNATYILIKRG